MMHSTDLWSRPHSQKIVTLTSFALDAYQLYTISAIIVIFVNQHNTKKFVMKLKIIVYLIGLYFVALFTACSDKHDYVDLGLPSGTLWATCNVGASAPTEVGGYFAWGETEPRTYFSWSSYKWGEKKNLTKYCTNSSYGEVDSLTVLSDADDAATVNWGSDWRMPLSDEIKELIDGCEWEHTNDYQGTGVEGMIGTSLYNKEKIFFPVAKIIECYDNGNYTYRTNISENTEYVEKGHSRSIEMVHFLSKELEKNHNNSAMAIYYNSAYKEFYYSSTYREVGNCIRAVRTKKIENQEKEVLKIFQDANALEADSVAEFSVVGNYKKQSLTISGYYNRTTDWTCSYTDTLVANGILYVMVRGVDQKKNVTKEPHKSAFFKREYKIPSSVRKVVFGPTVKTIWSRTNRTYELNGQPAAKLVSIIASTELTPSFPLGSYDIKEEDEVMHLRCRDTSEFASLMPKGYVYNRIFSSCDVNRDGKTDYLLAIEGPYKNGEYPIDEVKRSSEEEYYQNEESKHANEGIMLVISEGDTSYVSDIWNSECFYAVDEDGGAYIAPELFVSASKDSLEIHYGFGRNGYWKYNFVYRDGNYQLTGDLHDMGGAISTWYKKMDLDKGILEERSLKSDYPYDSEREEYEVSKYAIKRAFKYKLTNMKTFTL